MTPEAASLARRLPADLSGEGRYRAVRLGERWNIQAQEAGPMAPRQILQHAPPLLTARRHHRQHPLLEPAAVYAVGPAADPPPDIGVS